jgi:hypothetical protein
MLKTADYLFSNTSPGKYALTFKALSDTVFFRQPAPGTDQIPILRNARFPLALPANY